MSLNFNGSNHSISLPGSVTSLQNVAGATLTAWVVPDDGSNGVVVTFSVGGSLASRAALEIASSNWQALGRRNDGDGASIANGGAVTASALTFLCGLVDYSGQSISLLINASVTASTVVASWIGNTSNTGSQNSNMGSNESGSAPFFGGIVDDVRIYDRVLSLGEIQTIFAAKGTDGITFGLQHRFLLNESAPGVSAAGAGTIIDMATQQADATPSNSPIYAESLLRSRRKYL